MSGAFHLYKPTAGCRDSKSKMLLGDCECCGAEDQLVIYDAFLPPYGLWAWVCQDCLSKTGGRTGTGLGQRYQMVNDEEDE
jgi:hypothetical protein